MLVSGRALGALADSGAAVFTTSASLKAPPSENRGNTVLAETSGTTPGEMPSPYRQVESLNANVPIAHFRAVLGRESTWRTTRMGKEYLFISNDFCVHAVTARDGRVVLYAVTTLNEEFKPTFTFWRVDAYRSITLGSSRLADADLRPTQSHAYVYANRYEYFETHRLAGPGDYQTMILGDNYMGRPTDGSGLGSPAFLGVYGPLRRVSPSELRRFREDHVINTFSFSAPERDAADVSRVMSSDGFWIGPTAWDIGSVTRSSPSGTND
jgi:hypothetical protein